MPYVVRVEPNPYGQTYAPEPPAWGPPPAAPAPPTAAPAPARTRVGLVVLTAVLMEILLIGFGANQWVSDKIQRDDPADFRSRAIESSWLTFTWRFTPRSGLTRLWVSELVLIGAVLVLTALLVWVLARGPVSWARAFFGTWLAVVGGTLLGAFGRGLVDPFGETALPHTDRVTRALFGPYGPTSTVFVGGVGLGFVVALLASIVAVAARRSGTAAPAAIEAGPPNFPDYAPPPASAPTGPPPWQDRQWGPPPGEPFGAPGPAAPAPGATTQLPREPERPREPEQATTQLPPVEREQQGHEPEDATTQLPPVEREQQGHEPEDATTQLPPVERDEQPPREPERPREPEQPTTQLPPADGPPTGGPAGAPPAGRPDDRQPPARPAGPAEPPARPAGFPRPPDDEDLGHIEP
jgi:hypothetical protein